MSRLVRVRVSHDFNWVFPAADKGPSTGPGQDAATTIRFGGPMGWLKSKVEMVASRDVLYFDQRMPLLQLMVLDTRAMPDTPTSPVAKVAVRLDQYDSLSFHLLCLSIDNEALSDLMLVCTGDALRDSVKDTLADEWGFQDIPRQAVALHDPEMYRRGLAAEAAITGCLPPDQPLRCRFVFDGRK